LELIGRFAHKRIARELRRREAALREAEQPQAGQAPRRPLAQEPEAKPQLAEHASHLRNRWECDVCLRSFHGYGSYLNHRCDSEG
jgi:hypothetical protein